MNELLIKLERWSVVGRPVNEYDPPELWAQCLSGTVTGHPRKPDGSVVTTSQVAGVEQGRYVRTGSGSLYELGEVNPEYEARFPNARERVLAMTLSEDLRSG